MIEEILFDAFIDTAKMVPLLLMIYIGIELFEFKFGGTIKKRVVEAASAGPLVGAVAGSFPQCGFSVMATALYTQRLVTIGTLLAVYLSTSDEAIPILLADSAGAALLIPLILSKIAIGAFAGYAIDLTLRKSNRQTLAHIESVKNGHDSAAHHHETIADEQACCGHIADPASKKFDPREILLHPFVHTLKIFLFIFAISAALGLGIELVGQETLEAWFAAATAWQPVIAALIGLIPNCAASVAITQLYLEGALTYGATLAGLCASGGLGLLVLAREEKDRKNVFLVIGLLFAISVAAGYLTQYIF